MGNVDAIFLDRFLALTDNFYSGMVRRPITIIISQLDLCQPEGKGTGWWVGRKTLWNLVAPWCSTSALIQTGKTVNNVECVKQQYWCVQGAMGWSWLWCFSLRNNESTRTLVMQMPEWNLHNKRSLQFSNVNNMWQLVQ